METSTKYPYFIVNCPVYVPNQDSSTKQSDSLKGSKKHFEPVIFQQPSQTVNIVPICPLQSFLDKLERTGFQPKHRELLKTHVKVVFGLNRPQLLDDDEKNNILKEALREPVSSIVEHKKFGFFWNINWKESYSEVKEHYSRSDEETKEKVLIEERKYSSKAPMCTIRQTIKDNVYTSDYLKAIMDNDPTSTVYLTLIDNDVHDFNHIFSSYIDIVHEEKLERPQVMSTGYIIAAGTNSPERLATLKEKSLLDRLIRILTAKCLPKCTYYPEPNMCVLLKSLEELKQLSFIQERRSFNLEAPNLVSSLNGKFLFSSKPPILLEASGKMSKSASQSLSKGDQSHRDPRSWAMSLYYNKHLKRKHGKTSLIESQLKSDESQENVSHYTAITSFRNIFAYFDGEGCAKVLKGEGENLKNPLDLDNLIEIAYQYWEEEDVGLVVDAAFRSQLFIFAYYLLDDKSEILNLKSGGYEYLLSLLAKPDLMGRFKDYHNV